MRAAQFRFLLLTSAFATRLVVAQTGSEDQRHRAIYKEMVELNSSTEGGSVTRLARRIAARFLSGGYPTTDVRVVGPSESCRNVVVTLRGRNQTAKPILLLAHLDVVPARRADWKFDPFVLREEGGWFYGRGALDNKAGASILVANMLRWKRERFVPQRTIVLVLTCDEETASTAGAEWLLAHVPELRTAEFALNSDAGDVEPLPDGRAIFSVQAAEKVYATYRLEVRNPGGHSSIPRADNAIYSLALALGKVAALRFPVQFNEVTRLSFTRSADFETGPSAEDLRAAGRGEAEGAHIERLSRSVHRNANLRTTCVATMLNGGHAENALPQSATATVNCRIFPGVDAGEIQRMLERAIADTAVHVSLTAPVVPSPPSPMRADILGALERLSKAFWPGVSVIPGMSNGATDGLYFRNAGVPVYGVGAIAMDPDDDRSHGLDERVPVKSLYQAREFWYRLVKELADAQ